MKLAIALAASLTVSLALGAPAFACPAEHEESARTAEKAKEPEATDAKQTAKSDKDKAAKPAAKAKTDAKAGDKVSQR